MPGVDSGAYIASLLFVACDDSGTVAFGTGNGGIPGEHAGAADTGLLLADLRIVSGICFVVSG